MFNQFKGNNLLAFFIISVAILFISISLIIAKEIHSTKDGGNWNDKKTWVGSIIPQKEDDVVLNDTVVVTDIHYCDSLTIMPGQFWKSMKKEASYVYN